MMLFIIVEFGSYFYFVKANILSRLLVMVILIHYAAMLFTCSNILLRLPFASELRDGFKTEHTYGVGSVLSFLIVTALTFPMVWLFMRRVVRPAISLANNKSMKRGFIYLMSTLALYCGASVFLDFMFERSIYNNIGGVVLFLSLILTDFMMYYMFFFETKLVMENNRLTNRLQSFDEQYRRISRDIDEARRLRHDMRHHLNAISAINKNRENRELTEYLEAYSMVYAEFDSEPLSGYHALDNILRYYISSAKEKGVTVETKIGSLKTDMGFDVTDITVLIGNHMENAIEACERLSDEERFIKISIKRSEAELLIKEENSCSADLEPQNDFTGYESFTTTKHTKHTGQGLKSITLVTEKYGGSAEFRRENKVFTARIVLNIP